MSLILPGLNGSKQRLSYSQVWHLTRLCHLFQQMRTLKAMSSFRQKRTNNNCHTHILRHSRLPQEAFLRNATEPQSRRPCTWNWQWWPDRRNPSGLLESLWQGHTQAFLAETGFLRYQRQDQEVGWWLSLEQDSVSGSRRRSLLHRLNNLVRTSGLCPSAVPLLDLYQWLRWWILFFFFFFTTVSPMGNSGCFPHGNPIAKQSRQPTYCACWVF